MHEGNFDFYQYGGILREVTLHLLPVDSPFIDSIQVIPGENYQQGDVSVSITLGGRIPSTVSLATQFDTAILDLHSEMAVVNGRIHLRLTVPNPKVWSPKTPHLHQLHITLVDPSTRPIDDMSVRFGLRTIESRDGALWLNGELLTLKGYNRHEWHPNYGPCTPVLQMVADLQILRDLGCNFIRGAHYPQDQRFLDLCDEYGFLVWEENLGWGQREKTFASEKFRNDHMATLRAMVQASWNHPSVIIWGFLNEAATNQEYVRDIMDETVTLLRALDPSRLISYATMFALTDKYYDMVDLISLNIYPGWYDCEGVENPLDLIAPHLEKCLVHIDSAGWQDKPVLISEIGVEGLYGWHDSHHDFFTEEYQSAYLARACSAILAHPRCSGIAIWHFSDARTYSGGWSLKRPRTFNNKGTLDEYRRQRHLISDRS